VGSSLKFRLLVLPVAAVLAVVGIVGLRDAPVDVLPEFGPPTVQVQTEALGLSAVEVEQFITVPLEQDLLNGVPWLSTIRSQSVAGLSQVDLVFEPGTDVIKARQVVGERLTQAVALPHVSKAPGHDRPGLVDQPGHGDRALLARHLPDRHVGAGRWQIKPRLQGLAGSRTWRSGASASGSSRCRSTRSGWPPPA